MSSTTTARQLRRLAAAAVLTAAMAAVPASAIADGASGAAGAAAPSAAPKAAALLAHAKKVKPSGKAARAKGVGGEFVIGGPDSATGVFDELVHFYSWQRLPSGYWVRAVSVVHHANFGSESGYMWQYWDGSRAVSYALCLASTGCRAY